MILKILIYFMFQSYKNMIGAGHRFYVEWEWFIL